MKHYILLALWLLAPLQALAMMWEIDKEKSNISFKAEQAGKAFEGLFKTFDADIDFDPKQPEQGSIEATVNMASVDATDAQRNEALPQKEWFDTSAYPEATFISNSISAKGPDSFVAEGLLTIKGISKPAALQFTLKEEDGITTAQGKLSLNRLDYQVGTGEWENDEWIALPVKILITIVATPKGN